MGMPFDKREGKFFMGLEGGHTKRRILHAGGDATGKALTGFKLKKVKEKKSITPFEFTAVVKLLIKDNRIYGVQGYDFVSGKNLVFKAKAVILSTGGLSRIFARSTNPHTATGEGISLAWNSGAKIADLEFIQFHPSALCMPGKDAYLISEAVRGEGAWLLNKDGERFMKNIHQDAELAPRDIVAYSIFREIQKSDSDHIYLSLKHLDSKTIKRRFNHIFETLKGYGLDLTSDLIPVAPAAHYMVGGVRTNLDAETNISGLFVCGEAASTGVMGANRLASNSLLECLVFGKRASEKAATLNDPNFESEDITPVYLDANNEMKFLKIQNEIAQLMSGNLGIVRNEIGIKKALKRLEEIDIEYSDDKNEYNLLKIRNTVSVCTLIAEAALNRHESRGGHIREDFQQENADLEVHSIQQKGEKIQFEKVRK